MKSSNLMFLVLGLSIVFFGCSKDDFLAPELDQSHQVTGALKYAQKPTSNLKGSMELNFSFDHPPIFWKGTIDFGDGTLYGIKFISYVAPRDYSQASPFEEYFEIYDLIDPTIVYLGGPDAGVNTLANKPPEPNKFRMNGEIEVATEPFAMWLGRHVHMSGILTWQDLGTPDDPVIVPETATGIVRLN